MLWAIFWKHFKFVQAVKFLNSELMNASDITDLYDLTWHIRQNIKRTRYIISSIPIFCKTWIWLKAIYAIVSRLDLVISLMGYLHNQMIQ